MVTFEKHVLRETRQKVETICFMFERIRNLGMDENTIEKKREISNFVEYLHDSLFNKSYLMFKVCIIKGFMSVILEGR